MVQIRACFTLVILVLTSQIVSATIDAHDSRPRVKPKFGDVVRGDAEFIQGPWQSNKVENMNATLTLRDFGGFLGRKTTICGDQYYTDFRRVVALPPKWFQDKKRCNKFIEIRRNKSSVTAEVVDECDGGNECNNDSIGASTAVWRALNIEWRGFTKAAVDITWSDV